jgi:type IV pilus assembly protein PilQ
MQGHDRSPRRSPAFANRRLIGPAILAALGALTTAGAVNTRAAGAEIPTLRAISSRLDGGLSTILIEATEPVAYVTSQPDPLTVLVDLRNVRTVGANAGQLAGGVAPIRSVRVEGTTAGDGVPVARVRVDLERAAAHRVRSSRNLILVEVDRAAVRPVRAAPAPVRVAAPSRPAAAHESAAATRAASATSLKAIRALSADEGLGIAIVGNGRLEASSVEEARDLPPRVLLDFRGVAAGTAAPTLAIDHADIRRVRVALNSQSPLVTRVVIDLARKLPYRVEQTGAGGEELRVLFDEVTAAAPTAPQVAITETPAAEPVAAPIAPVAPMVPRADEPMMSLTADRRPVEPPAVVAAPAVPAAAILAQTAQPTPATPVGAASGAATLAASQGTARQQFTGHPITLDFQNADLRAVLRTFAEISGLNVVIDPSIQGTVDVSLKEVPWDQALDIILKANKLGYSVDGTIVRIVPLTVLAQEQEEQRKLAEAQALAGELRVLTRPLSYAKAQELVPIVTRSALSSRGEVQVDARTNTLIIRDLSDRLQAAADLLGVLDRPQPQVEIEARIVQTTRDFARSIGVQWGLTGRMDPALGNTTGLAFPNSGSLTGRVGGIQGPNGADNAVSLRANAASSALGLALGSVNGAFNLDVALSALEESGKGRLLSTPRVSTQNNVEAEITQGVQIPIQTVANNTVTVTFKDAALTLRVTPQITAAGTVIMRIALENAAPDFSRAVTGIPPIDTQRAITSVLVADGETTVIGGIFVSREQMNQDRVPFLHRVPLLGWLFKRESIGDESRELLIFITPRITKT